MEILISLSAPKAKYTDRQESLLWTMVHDKGHVLDANRPDSSLDALIKTYSESPKIPLYRGLYDKELMAIFKQSKSPSVKLDKYLSFSQNVNVARGFAKTSGTDTVLEILPGPKNKAFQYWKRTYDLMAAADVDKEFNGDEEEREMLLDGLKAELEWIYSYGFLFKILQSRSEGGIQVITISPV